MYRRSSRLTGRNRKLVIGLAAVALAGGAFAVSTGMSDAGESCVGLDQALQNNLNFIAGQQANPDSQSAARIANRQAVVDLINQRRVVAGCTGKVVAQPPAAQPPATQPPAAKPPAAKPPAAQPPAGQADGPAKPAEPAQPAPAKPAAPPAAGQSGSTADPVVCKGSTVTLFDEAGAPGASSGAFPIGTTLKVTNLDNNKSTTVKVTSSSGSCVLLNSAAFEQVREPGKFLIRHAVIQRVG